MDIFLEYLLIYNNLISWGLFLVFLSLQLKYFWETNICRSLFKNFFERKEAYGTTFVNLENEDILQLKKVGRNKQADLNLLIEEINHYVVKTKGTTDFSVIQNKVERKLNMRYEQAIAKQAFPTYLGLMGTFAGVFLGILMFNAGFDNTGNVTDASIKNLLYGVLISMSTSLIGLLLTTINNAKISDVRKRIEEDKNSFYDFVQTELMPSLDVSMVLAITRLHETIDRFEPAFDGIINRFQQTFDRCTNAFGNTFEQNVTVVSQAVHTMGCNMDNINENIRLQEKLLAQLKTKELIRGMEKYIAATDHFENITQSLERFEETREILLQATQESVRIQNSYAESLKIPREIAVSINKILDRIRKFEENINRVGEQLAQRDVLGNDVVNAIQEQLNGILKKNKVAEKYLENADEKLDSLFKEQTKLIDEMNRRYGAALAEHIEGFEYLLNEQTEELKKRHSEFLNEMNVKLNIEDIRKEFLNLQTLNSILEQLKVQSEDAAKQKTLEYMYRTVREISRSVEKIEKSEAETNKNSGFGGFLGFGRKSNQEK